jgi:hypothetical protein
VKVTNELGIDLDYNFCPGDLVKSLGGRHLGVIISIDNSFDRCGVMWSDKGITKLTFTDIFSLMKAK